MKRLLFITSGPIGDCVLSTGALEFARARLGGHPAITLVCGPLAGEMFRAVPGMERVLAIQKLPFDRHWLRLWRQLANQSFDLAVDLRGSGLTYALPCRQRIIGRIRGNGHQCARIGAVLGQPPLAPKLYLDEAAHDAALAAFAGQGFLALGPWAKFPGKCWPAHRFAEAAIALTAPGAALAGAPILVLGSQTEAEGAQALADICGATALAGKLDLLANAALLRRAALFIGNDSGLMHIAAAAGAPTLGLFGPSDETRYAPFGPKALALRGPRSFAASRAIGWDMESSQSLLQDLSLERVLAAAEAALTLGRDHEAGV